MGAASWWLLDLDWVMGTKESTKAVPLGKVPAVGVPIGRGTTAARRRGARASSRRELETGRGGKRVWARSRVRVRGQGCGAPYPRQHPLDARHGGMHHGCAPRFPP